MTLLQGKLIDGEQSELIKNTLTNVSPDQPNIVEILIQQNDYIELVLNSPSNIKALSNELSE